MKIQELLLEVVKKKAKKTTKAKASPKSVDYVKVAEDCRKKIIGSRQSKFGDCEDVSIAIAKAPFKIHPDIKIMDGFWRGDSPVEKATGKKLARGHVWCYIPSKQLIVDGTHDQFNKETRVNIIDKNHDDFEHYKALSDYDDNMEELFGDPEFKSIKTL